MCSQFRPECLKACLYLVMSCAHVPRLQLPAVLILFLLMKIPFTPCYLALFCSLHSNRVTSLPAIQHDQRSLNQELWGFGLFCVPGGKLLPHSGLFSESVGFFPHRENARLPSSPATILQGLASSSLPLLQAAFLSIMGPLEVGTLISAGQVAKQA